MLLVAVAVLAGAATPVLVPAPAFAVPNLLQVRVTTASTADGWKGLTATCPRRWTMLGAGADIADGGHGIHLAGMNLATGDNFASANVDKLGYAQPWALNSYAICGTQITGYSVEVADTPETPGNTYASATAYCPAGRKVIGAGGRTEGKPHTVLDTIHVSGDLSSVTVEVFGLDGFPPSAHAYAVCIRPVPGQQLVTASTGYTSSDKTLSVECPAGTQVHGVAGGITGAGGQAYIDRLAPHGVGLAVSGADIDLREDADGYAETWQATVQAICAN